MGFDHPGQKPTVMVHSLDGFRTLDPATRKELLTQPRRTTLVHGPAQVWLKNLPDACLDLTVTSPPYDQIRRYRNETSPFTWTIFATIARELARATKPGGVIVWVVGDQTHAGSESGSSFRQALHFKDQLGLRLETMIYASEKPPTNHRRYEQKFEYMFVLAKGNHSTWNPLREKSTYAGAKRVERRFRNGNEGNLQKVHGQEAIKNLKVRGNIWHYATGKNKSTLDPEAHAHPGIFPEALARDHILSWTNPGDLVCDPMVGSGTTAKMARTTNRRFVGGDQEMSYLTILAERLDRLDWDARDLQPEADNQTLSSQTTPNARQGHLGFDFT